MNQLKDHLLFWRFEVHMEVFFNQYTVYGPDLVEHCDVLIEENIKSFNAKQVLVNGSNAEGNHISVL